VNSREKLIASATDLFYTRGFLATSVDDLLSAAGVSKSNFYYHFRSKDALGLAVLDHRIANLQASLCGTLRNEALSSRERIRSFLSSIVAYQNAAERGGCPFGNLVAEMAHHDEEIRCRLSAMFAGLADTIGGVIQGGVATGGFRGDLDTSVAGTLVVQWAQGMCLMVKCHQCTEQAESSADLLYRLLISAPPAD
jgi:TetR/AcrR family transcriptional repressor of nem operon